MSITSLEDSGGAPERGVQLLRVPAEVHGRFLVRPPAAPGPSPLLIGFHGYAENAEAHLRRLQAIDPEHIWLICSIQALHPFFTRSNGEVVASWMTRLDRELAIQENLAYVAGVLEQLRASFDTDPRTVYCGFSQGAAMAFRTAVRHPAPSWVIALGAEIPPELGRPELQRLQGVLLARGMRDQRYPQERLSADISRLKDAGVETVDVVYDGGHIWPDGFETRVSEFLRRTIMC